MSTPAPHKRSVRANIDKLQHVDADAKAQLLAILSLHSTGKLTAAQAIDFNEWVKARKTQHVGIRDVWMLEGLLESLTAVPLPFPPVAPPQHRQIRLYIDQLNAHPAVKQLLKERVLVLYTRGKLSERERVEVYQWLRRQGEREVKFSDASRFLAELMPEEELVAKLSSLSHATHPQDWRPLVLKSFEVYLSELRTPRAAREVIREGVLRGYVNLSYDQRLFASNWMREHRHKGEAENTVQAANELVNDVRDYSFMEHLVHLDEPDSDSDAAPGSPRSRSPRPGHSEYRQRSLAHRHAHEYRAIGRRAARVYGTTKEAWEAGRAW